MKVNDRAGAGIVIGLIVGLSLMLTACSPQKPKLDGVSSATTEASAEIKAPLWQTLDNQGFKDLLKERKDQGAFIWDHADSLLVVADFTETKLPIQVPEAQNAVTKDQLGYSFVEVSPEAFTEREPAYLVVMVPKSEADKLDQIKASLKQTLAGKAMIKLARDQFYVWLVD